MRLFPALFAALLLPAAQPVLLSAVVGSATLLVAEAPVQAQSAEAVGRVAQAITVRIEGATQGSGVLVKRDGTRYTVLTAWHVVTGQRPGEELDIYTPDGKRHSVDQGSIKRLGDVDMAVLNFFSSDSYEVATVGDEKNVSMGSDIFVAGYPLTSSAVPVRLLRFLTGDVIANATVTIPDGYQLLYSNPTLPGMSGGSVLNGEGQLVGIHGRSERDDQVSMRTGKAIATGTNQGIPISYYMQFNTGQSFVAANTQATSADDYLAQAKAILGARGQQLEVIRLVNQALSIQPSALGYSYRGIAKRDLKDYQGAIDDYNKAIAINPKDANAYVNRSIAKRDLKDYQGAIDDCNKAIAINPKDASAYLTRGIAKYRLQDDQGAISDYDKAMAINPDPSLRFSVMMLKGCIGSSICPW